jgi:hypothetical protein
LSRGNLPLDCCAGIKILTGNAGAPSCQRPGEGCLKRNVLLSVGYEIRRVLYRYSRDGG